MTFRQTNSQLVSTAERLSRITGVVITVLGTLVLVGWFLDITALKNVFPGLATMKFNTALLFALAGISLATSTSRPQVARISAAAVSIVALLTLAQNVFNWDLGIDEWLIRDLETAAANGAFPGRMSIITAVNFALVSGCLLSMRRRPLLSQWLGLAAGFLSLLALAGYLYGVDALYLILPYSSMALHTALAFFVLMLGLLLASSDSGLMRFFTSSSAGGVLIRRLLPAAVIVPLLLGWLRFQGERMGLYQSEFGAALATLLNIVVFAVVIWWTARALDKVDLSRMRAEASLRESHDQLEQRVDERTAQLALANKELQRSEARFAGVLETAHDGIITVDEHQRIILFNHGAERMFGYPSKEVIGQSLNILLPERFLPLHEQHIKDFGTSGDATRIMAAERPEVRGKRKSGEEFPADISISSLQLDGEGVFTAVVRDITERVLASEALAASEERMSLHINSVRDYAIYMLDLDGHITSWNRGAERIKGYTAAEIMGEHYSLFFTEKDKTKGEPDRNLAVARAEGHYATEGWRVRKDGSRFWARIDLTAVHNDSGELVGFSKVTRDLTESKQAEDSLRNSEALLRQVLELLPVGVWITAADGQITLGNPAGQQIWAGAKYIGIEAYGEYKGWWAESGEPIEADDWAAARAVVHGETSLNENIEIECFDGSHKFLLNSAIPIRDEDQNIRGAIIVNQDVTGMKQAAASLRRYSDALERSNSDLQTFAYTASHDLQEPLRKIQAFGGRLESRSADVLDEQARDYLSRMINASNRMRTLIDDLLMYSRVMTRTQPFEPVDLNAVLAYVCGVLEVLIETTGARIERSDLLTIDADKIQMQQLFQNLISNAIKFHAPDRPPVIRVRGHILEQASSNTGKNRTNVLSYSLSISDNGIGFDEKYAQRIFGMFQRLHGRSEYEGTGIGLAICQKIVERHHGKIEAHGDPGHGATFVVTLPVRQTQREDERL